MNFLVSLANGKAPLPLKKAPSLQSTQLTILLIGQGERFCKKNLTSGTLIGEQVAESPPGSAR